MLQIRPGDFEAHESNIVTQVFIGFCWILFFYFSFFIFGFWLLSTLVLDYRQDMGLGVGEP